METPDTGPASLEELADRMLAQTAAFSQPCHALKQFKDALDAGQIPERAPVSLYELAENPWRAITGFEDPSLFRARGTATAHGMWAVVDLHWTAELARWIGDRRVLEVMAGMGWLSAALQRHGTRVLATDRKDPYWQPSQRTQSLTRVRPLSAAEAVQTLGVTAEILLVSWPPYTTPDLTSACRLWGRERPIIFIGESEGGCTADDTFFEGFSCHFDNTLRIPCWPGIRDKVWIGYWHGDTPPVRLPAPWSDAG